MRPTIDRRTLLSAIPAISLAGKVQTPEAESVEPGVHSFKDLRASSMYYRSCQYDVAMDIAGAVFSVHSWACGFLAHPASRSTYRQYPNLFESGSTEFSMPGLPVMRGELVERSEQIFGEDATLLTLSRADTPDASGALAICLNGALVQMLCLEPATEHSSASAESTIRRLTEAIQARDPDFYGRGEMNRGILYNHVAISDDIRLVFPNLRIREDSYIFNQGDGISNFWE